MAFPDSWPHRKKIGIKTGNLDASQSDFPLCVPLTSDTIVGGRCLSAGYDIRFSDADGTEIPYDRESFAVSSGAATGVFWVKCDPSTAGTDIYLYYGNSDALDGNNPTAVWSNGYAAVYHMNDATTSTILDSTENDNDGAKQAANHPAEVGGKIGNCQNYTGTPDYVIVAADSTLNFGTGDFTLEAWQKESAYSPVFEKRVGATGWILTADVSPFTTKSYLGINNNYFAFTGGLTPNEWGHLVCVISRATGVASLYVNGAWIEDADISAVSGSSDSLQDIYLGRNNDLQYLTGYSDEMRISSMARSAAWLKFEYYNMASADNELTWGDEEQLYRVRRPHGKLNRPRR